MGFFDDIFGDTPDFNGDGNVTPDESFLEYQIVQDIINRDSDESDSDDEE